MTLPLSFTGVNEGRMPHGRPVKVLPRQAPSSFLLERDPSGRARGHAFRKTAAHFFRTMRYKAGSDTIWSAAVALMPVADALAAILAGAEPLGEEMIALEAAHHRVLARDIAARRTQPPQAMSAMDGYAVRAADAAQVNAQLKVIGEVAAGRPFDRAIRAGEAARIFTGGVIPEGADAVVIQEDTVADGDRITLTAAAVMGR